MDQIKIGKFIAEESQRITHNVNWQINLVSAIKQSRNGNEEMDPLKCHCYFHSAMN